MHCPSTKMHKKTKKTRVYFAVFLVIIVAQRLCCIGVSIRQISDNAAKVDGKCVMIPLCFLMLLVTLSSIRFLTVLNNL